MAILLRRPVPGLLSISILVAAGAFGQERAPWPSFRGPAASGVADGQAPPLEWNAETGRNIAWSADIPGLGHSSPVVWGDRVFVTSALSDNPNPVFRYGTDGRMDRRTDRERNRWFVHAVDRDSGALLWSREVSAGVPEVQRHPKNSYASATPATDGERVVVLVASGDLSAWDFDGNRLWAAQLGPINAGASYDTTYEWGAASSPVLWGDFVIALADQQEGSFLAAFDKETGEVVWRVERDLISSFGTPTVHAEGGRTQVITNGAGTMHGYDVLTGAELWRMAGSSFNTTPTPVVEGGLIYLTSGYRFRPIFAIRADATGDISLADGTDSNEHVVWSSPRDGPYMASPLVYRGVLYVVSAGGVLTAFDADTGERLYKRRIGERGGAYTASPVAADGRIYFTSEDGDIFVIRDGPEYELLARNPMGGVALATPAISDGQFLVRTTERLVAAVEGASTTPADISVADTTPFPAALGSDEVLVLDDFEDGDLFSGTGVRWQTFTNGVSTAALRLVDSGAEGSGSAVRVDGELLAGAARGPLAQMYQPFDRGAAPVGLRNLGGLRLHARGSRPFQLTIRCGRAEYGLEIPVSDEWRAVEVEAASLLSFAAPTEAEAWSGDRCGGIYFSRRGEDALGPFWFELDGITLFGSETWPARDP